MPLKLTLHNPGAPAPLAINLDAAQPVTLGRASRCDVQLPFATISSQHFMIQPSGAGYQLTDLGSTNGTTLNGTRLPPHRPAPLSHGDTLQILDLRILVEVTQGASEGFTLAQSATFVRKLVSDALRTQDQSSDDAFFEVMRGPDRGRRFTLPDSLREGFIGRTSEALVPLPSHMPARAATIARHGDGFLIAPTGACPVIVNEQELERATPLRSRDRLRLGEVECVFFDPLQEYLEDLEQVPGQPLAASSAATQEVKPLTQADLSAAQTTAPAPQPSAASAPPTQPAAERPTPHRDGLNTQTIPPPSDSAPRPDTTDLVAAPPGLGANPQPPKRGWSLVEVGMLVVVCVLALGSVGILLVFLEIL